MAGHCPQPQECGFPVHFPPPTPFPSSAGFPPSPPHDELRTPAALGAAQLLPSLFHFLFGARLSISHWVAHAGLVLEILLSQHPQSLGAWLSLSLEFLHCSCPPPQSLALCPTLRPVSSLGCTHPGTCTPSPSPTKSRLRVEMGSDSAAHRARSCLKQPSGLSLPQDPATASLAARGRDCHRAPPSPAGFVGARPLRQHRGSRGGKGDPAGSWCWDTGP